MEVDENGGLGGEADEVLSWKYDRGKSAGGKLIFHGIHYIDALQWLTGVGPPQHELSSNKMALITSDCGANSPPLAANGSNHLGFCALQAIRSARSAACSGTSVGAALHLRTPPRRCPRCPFAARSLPRCAAPLPPLPRCLPFPRSFVDTVASHCCCILAACGDRVRTRAYWRGHYSLLSAFPLCYVPRLGSYLWSTPPLGGPLEGCADKGVTARALAAGGSAIQNEDAAVASFKLRSAGLHGL